MTRREVSLVAFGGCVGITLVAALEGVWLTAILAAVCAAALWFDARGHGR